ncbi:GtrA family protein [Streptomyces sp. NBC_00536]|uniref:GtrA family protein n=1 Tax=Streptomyces sp. NBC_00536 TaxID=2975769 RepID=UPI002E8133CF|nr:GtrA family protein [Streptomyces sp. NBC_00536]WUC78976.1 GtrA family protein [Streptomyces sp. NBC_00536]
MKSQLGQILRFGLVGGVNTGTFFVLYLLLHPHMPYFAAYSLAFVLAMVGSFFMNTYFTYRTKPTWKKFLLFPLTNITNYVIQSVGLLLLVDWAGMNEKIAPLVAAVIAIPFTYVISRRILIPGADPAPAADPSAGNPSAGAERPAASPASTL